MHTRYGLMKNGCPTWIGQGWHLPLRNCFDLIFSPLSGCEPRPYNTRHFFNRSVSGLKCIEVVARNHLVSLRSSASPNDTRMALSVMLVSSNQVVLDVRGVFRSTAKAKVAATPSPATQKTTSVGGTVSEASPAPSPESASAGASTSTTATASTRCSSSGTPVNWLLFSALARDATLALALDDDALPVADAADVAGTSSPPDSGTGSGSSSGSGGGKRAGAKGAAVGTASHDSKTATTTNVSDYEEHLAGLLSFALSSAIPGPRTALSLGKSRAATVALAKGSGTVAKSVASTVGTDGVQKAEASSAGGRVRAELLTLLSSVRLVRPRLGRKLAGEDVPERPREGYGIAGIGAGSGDGGGKGKGNGEKEKGRGRGRDERIGKVVMKEFVLRCAMTAPQAEVYSSIAR